MILSRIFSESHVQLGGPHILKIHRRGKHIHVYKNAYLIKRELIERFDFNAFINTFSERNAAKIKKSYEIDLLNIINCAFKPHYNPYDVDKEIYDAIVELCKKILFSEFQIRVSSENAILMEQNTKKLVSDPLLDYFRQVGHVLTLNELFDYFNENYPGLYKNKGVIRSCCIRKDNSFTSFGRSSTYGLKEWETENNTIRGGTIRDLAEEFILQYDQPCRHVDIVSYVLKYRPGSNFKNIMNNLHMETQNRFLFFKGSLIGVGERKYDQIFLDLLIKNPTKQLKPTRKKQNPH